MDWNAAIERNKEALRRILAMLVAMAGLGEAPDASAIATTSGNGELPCKGPAYALSTASGGGEGNQGDDSLPGKEVDPRPMLARRRHRAILALLRPAEAAARRLIIIAAHDVPVPQSRESRPKPASIFVRHGKGTGIVLPGGVPRPGPRRAATPWLTLPLTDALRALPRHPRMPRIRVPGIAEPHRILRPPSPNDAIDATRLALRLHALGHVLDDLPAHARRFARWRNRAAAGAQNKNRAAEGTRHAHIRNRPRRLWPLRPGRPPGGCRRPAHEVHEVLADLHHFAFRALEQFHREAVLRNREGNADTS